MAPTDVLTVRIDPALKAQAEQAAKAEDRTLTDFVLRAMRQRLATQCDRCGRGDQPPVGAGLSTAFDAFLTGMKGNHSRVTIVTDSDRPRAYSVRIRHRETSQGLLLTAIDHPDGEMNCPIPRGFIVAWQEDPHGDHHSRLTQIGYVNGNDSIIRAGQRGRAASGITIRLVSDAICASPGVTADALSYALKGYANNAVIYLTSCQLITIDSDGKLFPRWDADTQLQAARDAGLEIDRPY